MVGREEVLRFFKEESRRPLSFREIVSLMGLGPAKARALKKVLRALVKGGQVVRTKRGLYGSPEEMELVTGSFEAHGDGYGFVIQDRPGTRDLFVPAKAALSAMDGDRVVARVEDRRKWQGRVMKVIERANARIVGTMEVTRQACYVKPRNRTVGFEVYIPPKLRGGAADGQRVLAEITEFPSGNRPAAGRVLKVLPLPSEPKEEAESIIEEFGLPKRFPTDAVEEARLLRAKKPGRRKSFVQLNTVTIDGESARDFDDAVSVRLEKHGYTLWVHIADVGHYVGWDSALDLESRRRGTSVYFPDRVIPMLPKELSEDLCSLRPGVDRAAFTVELGFDRSGTRTSAAFYPSLIRSDERMTYTSVRKILVDGDAGERQMYDRLLPDIELMGELASILRRERLQRGSLDFDLPEPEVLLDVQGRPEAIIRAERNFAHMLIEEFMIAANEAVAEYLSENGAPCLYRVHEEPDRHKVEEVMKALRPGRPPTGDASSLIRLLAEVKGSPEEEIVSYHVLRSLKQARYSPENVGHFGLASGCYCHFTSPIRRYPDLVVHRILRELLQKKRISDRRMDYLESALPEMAFHSSRAERVADEAENDMVNAMRMWFMKDKVGDEFAGKVSTVGQYGMRVRLNEFYVEGFMHVSDLTDDYYIFDPRGMSLVGKHTKRSFRLGQEVTVRVDMVDIEARELSLGIVGG